MLDINWHSRQIKQTNDKKYQYNLAYQENKEFFFGTKHLQNASQIKKSKKTSLSDVLQC